LADDRKRVVRRASHSAHKLRVEIELLGGGQRPRPSDRQSRPWMNGRTVADFLAESTRIAAGHDSLSGESPEDRRPFLCGQLTVVVDVASPVFDVVCKV